MSDTDYEQIDRETLFSRRPDWLRWDDIPVGLTFFTKRGLAYEKVGPIVATERYYSLDVHEDEYDDSDPFDDFPYFAADVTLSSDDMD